MTDPRGRYMLTYTGKKFYPLDIRPDDICIEDIAHGLAGEGRFGNQAPRRISVAEHSLMVSHLVPSKYALWGLLHDASEAYIKDIPSPVKAYLLDYKIMEEALMAVIAEVFKLTPEFQHDK